MQSATEVTSIPTKCDLRAWKPRVWGLTTIDVLAAICKLHDCNGDSNIVLVGDFRVSPSIDQVALLPRVVVSGNHVRCLHDFLL